MSKPIAEQCNDINISFLKKRGLLSIEKYGRGIYSGTLSWTRVQKMDEVQCSICIEREDSFLMGNRLSLRYNTFNRWTGAVEYEWRHIAIVTTPCNYGGVRYWFQCRYEKDGKVCNKRVGVIYRFGDDYACRHCANITYNSQLSGGKYRGYSVSLRSIDEYKATVKRNYYNGKPTRKYKRCLEMERKFGICIRDWGRKLF